MKILKRITVLILVFSMLFTYSCDNDNGDDTQGDNKTPEKITYTVKVLSSNGVPVEGVIVYVHKGDADMGLVDMGVRTDEEGIATFTLDEASDYSIQLDKVPERYIAKNGLTRLDRYPMGESGATITLERNPDYVPTLYKLGDEIADFTLTDVNGVSYTLYELLKVKKAVVLNFWFVGCDPCATEFPALNTAYKAHKAGVEVLAINDRGIDSTDSVAGYSDNKGFGLEMPIFRVDPATSPVNIAKFAGIGWPTTVIIDRYGVICFVHSGAITATSAWDNAFEYFTSDTYEQQLFTSINDIPGK